MTPSLTITDAAQEYIAELLAKQGGEVNIRVFVADPGTPKAESCVAYCRPGEEEADDLPLELRGFKAFIEARSLPFLEEALIDYAKDRFGGQLTIKAPHAKIGRIDASSPLEDRINHVLYVEVNPNLAAHGGEVSLVEVVDGSIAVLKFGGGCQGCGMVDATLKEGVERTLVTQIPEITAVRDVTDHSVRDHAYY
ncbi:MAG TPA: Fe-S biogenesis protein NfuA [Pseudomonadales bacterium]|jgi:Fe/S biogenesis protein NfuA|nr:Fe-S biogenesis protein NfuA [Pseudomonadales bacterium]HMY96916.1 Fe-S biogenesis protein NfuA [Pseudomonadales bacterium]HMZ92354.1 Fe-S biogenesis protein NfuA [Pseudomonadales bacterium]HNB84754.1 Fe-S biogenesis protein NfuA [Pseudomonadales bacterium]HNC76947.1 Fe-S biogenesis protein NfuA [Pseudomonadales bacterium]